MNVSSLNLNPPSNSYLASTNNTSSQNSNVELNTQPPRDDLSNFNSPEIQKIIDELKKNIAKDIQSISNNISEIQRQSTSECSTISAEPVPEIIKENTVIDDSKLIRESLSNKDAFLKDFNDKNEG
jgi:hypothetical protein